MFTGQLDTYQQPAVDKFTKRKTLLVAYTMGLGKTPIAIAAAEQLFEAGEIKCCLIVCPASLKYQWAQKIAQFTDLPKREKKVGKESIVVPGADCFIVDGDKKNREGIYSIATARGYRPRYIILGYDNVLIDHSFVSKIKPDMVVLDEATAIKSFKAARSKRIKKLLRSPYRLALTGTPIENRPDELFSIMQWVDEGCLGRYDLFEKAYINRNQYGWVVSYKNLPVLQKRLEPAVSRLTDEDVEVKTFMPATSEENWYVDFDEKTWNLYRHISQDMLAELDKQSVYDDFNVTDFYQGVDESRPSGKLMGMYMCLEMLANHPDLIVWSAKMYQSEKKGGSRYAYELWQSGAVDDIFFSPKLTRMMKELSETNSAKTLIFSKYKFMIGIINQELPNSVQFHGGMSPIQKAEAVARFTNDSSCHFFLSSHAGAYGMDMNMSDFLINYDLPWSAGKRDQINYRHKRRSSLYDTVYVKNLIVTGSFEERRLRILDRKKRIATSILDGKGAEAHGRIQVGGDSLRQHLEEVLTNPL